MYGKVQGRRKGREGKRKRRTNERTKTVDDDDERTLYFRLKVIL
jgi:hypothetical protein